MVQMARYLFHVIIIVQQPVHWDVGEREENSQWWLVSTPGPEKSGGGGSSGIPRDYVLPSSLQRPHCGQDTQTLMCLCRQELSPCLSRFNKHRLFALSSWHCSHPSATSSNPHHYPHILLRCRTGLLAMHLFCNLSFDNPSLKLPNFPPRPFVQVPEGWVAKTKPRQATKQGSWAMLGEMEPSGVLLPKGKLKTDALWTHSQKFCLGPQWNKWKGWKILMKSPVQTAVWPWTI